MTGMLIAFGVGIISGLLLPYGWKKLISLIDG